ncbi:hypothetical protein G6L13_19075 [Agrobacterium tumefaciens]|uniref:hypothetical protein n=1 Tax=Agrobacterium tumefaciens TaxID=358 RepID=UPI001572AD9A|nr:hypothetical protein [Agrobacterium tumefaciens]NTA82601.1 hypothetical protein [Agrobacterium tumefaciens]
MKQTIYYVDALPGAGKTHSLHRYLKTLNEPAIIATPTNLLSFEQHNDLAAIGVKSKVISQETGHGNCTQSLVKHCEEKRDSIAIINHNVAKLALEATAGHHLFIDEFFSPVEKFVLKEKVKTAREFVVSIIKKSRASHYVGFIELVLTEAVEDIVENGMSHDSSFQALPHLREIAKRISSEDYLVLVSKAEYQNFVANIEENNDEEDGILNIYAWLQPSALRHNKTVSFAGANFFQTKLYHAWKDLVNFVPHPSIKGERYDDFSHKAANITFRHLLDQDVSMSGLEKVGYQKFVDATAGVFLAEYGAVDHLVTLSAKSSFTWPLNNSEMVPPNPVGLNAFMDRHVCLHLAPLNPSKLDERIWNAVTGISKEELHIAQSCEMVFQMLTRSSVRDHGSESEELVFIVLDLRTANYLRNLFGVTKPSKRMEVRALNPIIRTRTKHKDMTVEERREYDRKQKAIQRARKKAAAAEQVAHP